MLRSVVALGVLAALVLVGLAPAAVGATQCAEPGTALSPVPWAQQRLAPETIWPVADGAGVKVAVIASGVDANHPQLAGAVSAGQNLLPGDERPANSDCGGLGTQVAGVIAAAQSSSVGFHGLAPRATIVPIRVTDEAVIGTDGGADSPTPATLASAVRAAITRRPAVMVIPVVTYVDAPALRSAVADAVAADIVVIAAVGDVRKAADGPVVPYPAAYHDVIGVGAVDQTGALGSDSAVSSTVDLVAPGEDLVSTQRGGGLASVSGTAIAAGYVAGVVALIRSRWTVAPATEVVRRLLATATPLTGEPGYGDGLVNPEQAVSATMASGSPSPMPAVRPPGLAGDQSAWSRSNRLAVVLAGALATVGLLVVVIVVAVPRGRRRRWRPGLAPPPIEHPEDDLPSPPVLLFEDRG